MAELGFDPATAIRHLRKADPDLARVIDAAGPFEMKLNPARSVFQALARAIVYQQLSNKAAATIFGRVCVHFPRGHVGLTPERLLALSDARIRGAGISRPKLKSLRDLARRSASGEVPTLAQARRLSDGEIVEHGLTGFIVANEQEAAGAVPRLATLSRSRIRARFEERFTARRMAKDYLDVYRQMAESHVPRLRVVKG